MMLKPETGFGRIFVSGFYLNRFLDVLIKEICVSIIKVDIYPTGVYYIRNDYKILLLGKNKISIINTGKH